MREANQIGALTPMSPKAAREQVLNTKATEEVSK